MKVNWKRIFTGIKFALGIEQTLEQIGVIPQNKIDDKVKAVVDSIDKEKK